MSVFLDDILVYSATLQDHEAHLCTVLALLREHKLYAKASKCSFACNHIKYLGHIISRDGVATDTEKTAAMIKWPTPTNTTKLISALHNSAVNGHSRTTVTHHRVKKLFVWRGMKVDVDNYVQQCLVCQQTKHEHSRPVGKLEPLPVPTIPWHDLTMDFVEGLPKFEGYNTFMVVVDRLTKFAHFIPLRHPFTTTQVTRAFWDNIVKFHGVPASIVSDRDMVFTSAVERASCRRGHATTVLNSLPP